MKRSAESREALAARLTSAGIAPSKNRLLVLDELSREADDATAQVVHKRLAEKGESIGLATVYRALGVMSEAGVVDALPHGTSETCYRLCSDAHHHHLVCERCHRVIELHGCPAEDWIARRARKEGFAVTGHRLEVTGLCSDCRQSATTT